VLQVSKTHSQSSRGVDPRFNPDAVHGVAGRSDRTVRRAAQALFAVRRSHAGRETWRSAGRRRVSVAVPSQTLELQSSADDDDDNDVDDFSGGH